LLIGDAKTVAKKILYVNEVLGGISRVTFQMGVSTLPHQKMLDAVEILGIHVAPIVRNELRVTPISPDDSNSSDRFLNPFRFQSRPIILLNPMREPNP
jgi:hypothetical protein